MELCQLGPQSRMVATIKSTQPFVLQRREAVLQFSEDSEFHGLEVRAKLDVDIATFLQFQKLGDNPDSDDTRILFGLYHI